MLLQTAVIACLLAQPTENPSLPELLERISPQRMKADVQKLADFGTRHTLSSTTDPVRGIGAARDWLLAEMRAAGGELSSGLETFDAPPSTRLPQGARVVNVVGRLKGTENQAPQRVYYVVGHYDSRNADGLDATGDAPGANDDASGTSVVLELARVLAANPLESTVVFLCTAAEEQGLIGANFHAAAATADESVRVMAVLSNDIVGDPWGPNERDEHAPERRLVRVFSEGLPRSMSAAEYANMRNWAMEHDGPGRQLARFIAAVGVEKQTFVQPKIVFRQDRFLRGGDHISFAERGIAAVRFTVMHEDFSRQHADVTERDGKPYGDVAEFVDADYMADVARLNLATLYALANAPSQPSNVRMITKALTNDTELKWEASPEPDVAGYEVVWRDTTEWNWSNHQDVGMATTATLAISKDTNYFGVRAYDKDGNRSVVQFAAAAQE